MMNNPVYGLNHGQAFPSGHFFFLFWGHMLELKSLKGSVYALCRPNIANETIEMPRESQATFMGVSIVQP
jgi:hypothetical protein